MKNTIFAFILFVIAAGVILFFDFFGFQGQYDDTVFEKPTTLQITSGVVSVNSRNAGSGQELFEGDVITTNADTEASIVFFDDSISRLQSGTTVTIATLDDTTYFQGGGAIELLLENGEVWSKVQKQTGDSFEFGVGTRRVNATIRGSALNVAFDGETTSVEAAEHTVRVTARDDEGEVIDTTALVEGSKVVLTEDFFEPLSAEASTDTDVSDEDEPKLGVRRLASKVTPLENTDTSRPWFSQNVSKDDRYVVQVEEERKEVLRAKVGALPGTVGYRIKTLKDSVDLALASEEEKVDIQLNIAKRSFAEVSLVADTVDASVVNKTVEQATDILETIHNQTQDERVQKEVQKTIQHAKISVRNALPTQGAYEVKEALRSVEVQTATPERAAVLIEKHLERKVLDIHDLKKEKPDEQRVEELKQSLREQLRQSRQQDIHDAYLDATSDKAPAVVVQEKAQEASRETEPEPELNREPVERPVPVVSPPVIQETETTPPVTQEPTQEIPEEPEETAPQPVEIAPGVWVTPEVNVTSNP